MTVKSWSLTRPLMCWGSPLKRSRECLKLTASIIIWERWPQQKGREESCKDGWPAQVKTVASWFGVENWQLSLWKLVRPKIKVGTEWGIYKGRNADIASILLLLWQGSVNRLMWLVDLAICTLLNPRKVNFIGVLDIAGSWDFWEFSTLFLWADLY